VEYENIKRLRVNVMNTFGIKPRSFPFIFIMAGLLPAKIATAAFDGARGSASSVKHISLEPLHIEHLRQIYFGTLQRLLERGSWPVAGDFLAVSLLAVPPEPLEATAEPPVSAALPMPPVEIPPALLEAFLAQVLDLCGGVPRQLHRMVLIGLLLHNVRVATKSALVWKKGTNNEMACDLVGIAGWCAANYSSEFVYVPGALASIYIAMVFCDINGIQLDSRISSVKRLLAYQAFLPAVQVAVPGNQDFVTLKTAPIFSLEIFAKAMEKKTGDQIGAIVFADKAKAGEMAIVTAIQLRTMLPMVFLRASLGTVPILLDLHAIMPWLNDAGVPNLIVPVHVEHMRLSRRNTITEEGLSFFEPLRPGLHIVQPKSQSPSADIFAFFRPEEGTSLMVEFQRKTGVQRISQRDLALEVAKSIAMTNSAKKCTMPVDVVFVLVADALAGDLEVGPGQRMRVFNTEFPIAGMVQPIPKKTSVVVLSPETVFSWLPNIDEPVVGFSEALFDGFV
jgi:hypothetical protein